MIFLMREFFPRKLMLLSYHVTQLKSLLPEEFFFAKVTSIKSIFMISKYYYFCFEAPAICLQFKKSHMNFFSWDEFFILKISLLKLLQRYSSCFYIKYKDIQNVFSCGFSFFSCLSIFLNTLGKNK
jgi:hypothetical protein